METVVRSNSLTFRLFLGLALLSFDKPQRALKVLLAGGISIAVALAFLAAGGRATTIAPAERLQRLEAPPQPPPLLLRDMSRSDALAINARIPFSTDQNISAKPFRFRGDKNSHEHALECLSLAVYYEAANQADAGQEAVAQVVLNRVRHPAFPASICGVVFQGSERRTGCQFTFTCDGSLFRRADPQLWGRARRVAEAALDGSVFQPVGLATHYHADYVVPYWAASLEKNAQVGAHIFYRWPDAWGKPGAFTRRYAGNEEDPFTLRTAAMLERDAWVNRFVGSETSVQVDVDPRLELLSVVQMLATGESNLTERDRRYEHDVRTYFLAEANHPAVQLFAKLTKDNSELVASAAQLLLQYSPPPELSVAGSSAPSGMPNASDNKDLDALVDALRDFAQSSDFMRFFKGHRPFYKSIINPAEQQVGMARAYWSVYTRMPLPQKSFVLTTLGNIDDLSACGSAENPLPSVLSVDMLANASPAAILSRTDGANALASSDGDNSGSAPAIVDDQMIRAVFARIADLHDRTKLILAAAPGGGDDFNRSLEDRLRDYERHFEQFPTLGAFLAAGDRSPSQTKLSSSAPARAQCLTAAAAPAAELPAFHNLGI